MEFDLLLQNNLPLAIKPVASPRIITPSTETSTSLLVPFIETGVKQLDISNDKQPRQDSDVSMLDTGVSSTENSITGNEDVQLLHSPPLSKPIHTPTNAPTLSDILLKFEEIKPSKDLNDYFIKFSFVYLFVFIKVLRAQYHYWHKSLE